MSDKINDNQDENVEARRREVLSKLASYCVERNFKFDVISPKKWITLTFESRNPKQDQGIDIFIDVRPTDDIYFVVPAAYDVLLDDEIPAVLKAVNVNNNYVNPARCSYSERSKKVIVDYTYPLIDGGISLEQFTRILMFVLESAEALRDNISTAQKSINDLEEIDEEKVGIPEEMLSHRKRTDTKMYLQKLGSILGDNIEDDDNIAENVNILENSKIQNDDYSDAVVEENDIIEEQEELDEEESQDGLGEAIMHLFEEVVKNIGDLDEEDAEYEDEEEEYDDNDEDEDEEDDDEKDEDVDFDNEKNDTEEE